MSNHLEIDRIGWDDAIWNGIKQAIHNETNRIKIAKKVLPMYGPLPESESVPSDIIEETKDGLIVNEGASTIIVEISVQFGMTKTQIERERLGKGDVVMTLATRAANLIALAQDELVFQGKVDSIRNVEVRLNGNNSKGLLGEDDREIKSTPIYAEKKSTINKYGANTFRGVTDAISDLQKDGHYGPYALILSTDTYADTFAPLEDSLVMPADRIKPLVIAGFYGTGTLPKMRGILLSLGGNTMDLVIGVDATPEFMFLDNKGIFQFRVFERFTLRLKNKFAVRRLEFTEKTQDTIK